MKVINSENPIEHWNEYKNIKGSVVLDLGCGWLHNDFENTPEYFINRGCKKVIGVDVSIVEIQKLQEVYPDHIFIHRNIQDKTDLTDLFTSYKPEIVKMDIEGKEDLINDMSVTDWDSVNEIMIEYHNPECKQIIETKLAEFGFEIKATNRFGWFCTDHNIMGVIYATR